MLIIAFLLFNYPLLSFVNNDTLIWDIPLLYLYLFSLWLFVIILSTLINTIRRDEKGVNKDHGGPT